MNTQENYKVEDYVVDKFLRAYWESLGHKRIFHGDLIAKNLCDARIYTEDTKKDFENMAYGFFLSEVFFKERANSKLEILQRKMNRAFELSNLEREKDSNGQDYKQISKSIR